MCSRPRSDNVWRAMTCSCVGISRLLRAHGALTWTLTLASLAACGGTTREVEPQAQTSVAPPQPSAPQAPPATAQPSAPPHTVTLAPNAPLAWGCFAWSEARHAVACVTGYYGENTPDTAEPPVPRRYVVQFLGDSSAQPIPLLDAATAASDSGDPSTSALPLSAATRAALQAALDAGGYERLSGDGEAIRPGVAREWGDGAAVRWTNRQTASPAEQGAERFSDRVGVRFGRDDAFTPLGRVSENQPAGDSGFVVYAIPGERFLVLEQRWRYADEGEFGGTTVAFLCDRVERRCQ